MCHDEKRKKKRARHLTMIRETPKAFATKLFLETEMMAELIALGMVTTQRMNFFFAFVL